MTSLDLPFLSKGFAHLMICKISFVNSMILHLLLPYILKFEGNHCEAIV